MNNHDIKTHILLRISNILSEKPLTTIHLDPLFFFYKYGKIPLLKGIFFFFFLFIFCLLAKLRSETENHCIPKIYIVKTQHTQENVIHLRRYSHFFHFLISLFRYYDYFVIFTNDV